MKKKSNKIKDIIIVLNSIKGFGKYPIGNRALTNEVKELEKKGEIYYEEYSSKWKERS